MIFRRVSFFVLRKSQENQDNFIVVTLSDTVFTKALFRIICFIYEYHVF